jgi:NADH dehydrogenase
VETSNDPKGKAMKCNTICVLGGTGFVGQHLVTRLANEGRRVRVLTRNRERHRQFLVMPNVELIEANALDPQALAEQFAGQDAVINLIGILNGSEQAFRALHGTLPGNVAQACAETGVRRLLHMSALNADASDGPSIYLRTKGAGESAAHEVQGVQVTSFQPSVIFGPDDSFFNRFAALLKLSPVIPLACPNARFAPVYIDDVVRAFTTSLENESTFGQRYELCGPRIFTLKELVEYTAALIGRKRLIIGLSDRLSQLQARVFERIPGKPFTLDNFLSMQVDSVCRCDGLAALGIKPCSVDAVMPPYFRGREGVRSRYSGLRRVARR